MRIRVLYEDLDADERSLMLNGCGPQHRWYDAPELLFHDD